jgi:Tfp pilus assembly protein PilX
MIARANHRQRELGAATLVIVMALFILIGLLAAYGNRNLVFEQRMAGSTYRTAIADQTAESAVDWALSMLNADFSDTACAPTTTARSFADRYIVVDKGSRAITLNPTPPPSPDTSLGMGAADCVKVAGGGWSCRCLEKNAASKRAALGAAVEPQPSFIVSFSESRRSGTVLINTTACTSSVVQDCASKENTLLAREAVGQRSIVIGFVPAIRTPPSAAITVKGRIESTDGNLGIHNADPSTNGTLVVTGNSAAPSGLVDAKLESLPGTPPRTAIFSGDASLAAGDVFKMLVGMPVSRFKLHPGVRHIACNPDCATELTTAVQKGATMLLIDGNMDITTATSLGTATRPVFLVVTGAINISADFTMFGMVHSGGNFTWNAGGGSAGYLVGAATSSADFSATGTVDIAYSADVSEILRNKVGSFVRVSGGWYDKPM